MANIEISTLTRNNDGNTYIIKDANAIPKTGSNQISGDLIPATDNSIDVGSSTKNLKMLYTKGITIDGKTIDTDANGNMTYDSHIVDTIEEQGNGYIRYSNGIQICCGTLTWQSACSMAWDSLYETSPASESYAKSFVEPPSVSISGNIGTSSAMIDSNVGSNTRTPSIWLCRPNPVSEIVTCTARYIAIGRWK